MSVALIDTNISLYDQAEGRMGGLMMVTAAVEFADLDESAICE